MTNECKCSDCRDGRFQRLKAEAERSRLRESAFRSLLGKSLTCIQVLHDMLKHAGLKRGERRAYDMAQDIIAALAEKEK